MGGIEVDRHGNVNAHKIGSKFVGIGGFANITNKTKTVVFCLTFTTKGLSVEKEGGKVKICKEGRILKFKKSIHDISFSASNALKNGQKVLYVTERCVFGLTQDGIQLLEVFDGIDKQKDIIDLLDFEL
jgi:propionate CoA-transferase